MWSNSKSQEIQEMTWWNKFNKTVEIKRTSKVYTVVFDFAKFTELSFWVLGRDPRCIGFHRKGLREIFFVLSTWKRFLISKCCPLAPQVKLGCPNPRISPKCRAFKSPSKIIGLSRASQSKQRAQQRYPLRSQWQDTAMKQGMQWFSTIKSWLASW